jgi:very-short-patch-repair endonuclease
MQKYKLINEIDGIDSIDFQVQDDQDPCTVALEQLGWYIVATTDDGSNNEEN